MAIKIAITGDYNTGKSFSRKFIKKGEEVFIIAPSSKSIHLTDSDNKPLKRFNIKTKNFKNLDEAAKVNNADNAHELIPKLTNANDLEITGNHVVCGLSDVENYLKFVSRRMPYIKTVILPDFTHFISAVLASKKFINRSSGGNAFARLNLNI